MDTNVALPSACAIGELLDKLTRPWTLHILWVLGRNGPMRFGVLKRSIEGISARVLTERLRGLEESGFVYRDYKPTIPPEVTYGLTTRTAEINKVMDTLQKLAEKWRAEDASAKPSTQRKR